MTTNTTPGTIRTTVDAQRLAAEARGLSPEEFAARNPYAALAVEPLVGRAALAAEVPGLAATDLGVTSVDVGGAAPAAARAGGRLNPNARVLWIKDFEAGCVRIGRDPECELALPHPLISRVHAAVRYVGGAWYVEDHSANGTFLNGRRVASARLASGDVIVIANVVAVRVALEPARLHELLATLPSSGRIAPPRPRPYAPVGLREVVDELERSGPAALLARFTAPVLVASTRSGTRSLDAVAVHPLAGAAEGRGVVVGRAETADVVVRHASVSVRQAVFTRRGEEWSVRDGSSLHGTRVGAELVSPEEDLPLEGDDVTVELGEVRVRFLRPAAFVAYVEKIRAASSAPGAGLVKPAAPAPAPAPAAPPAPSLWDRARDAARERMASWRASRTTSQPARLSS